MQLYMAILSNIKTKKQIKFRTPSQCAQNMAYSLGKY